MKKDNYLNFGHNRNINSILVKQVMPDNQELDVHVQPVAADSFLRLVYALDPISKLPTGDLGYMVSDKANPEVKQWVLANLQMDTSSAANIKAPAGLPDDDLIELTRKQGESVEAYANRVNVFMSNNKRIVDDAIEQAKKRYVPVESSNSAVSSE